MSCYLKSLEYQATVYQQVVLWPIVLGFCFLRGYIWGVVMVVLKNDRFQASKLGKQLSIGLGTKFSAGVRSLRYFCH